MTKPFLVNITPVDPIRPLRWSPAIDRLSTTLGDEAPYVFIVGGVVRDALYGVHQNDIDLVSFRSGTQLARHIANSLGGHYYPLDKERDVGRAIVEFDSERLTVDASSLRGSTLQDDLGHRDFTINAMAVQMQHLSKILDPLHGQDDLIVHKILRPCSASSIKDDPIRAYRALRYSLRFGLRMDGQLVKSIRQSRLALVSSSGQPLQPERLRDELHKLIHETRPGRAFRVLAGLGLMTPLQLTEAADSYHMESRLATVDMLSSLLSIFGPATNDEAAANLTFGLAATVLHPVRAQIQHYLEELLAGSRERRALLYLAAISEPGKADWQNWGTNLRLSNDEWQTLQTLDLARGQDWEALSRGDDRAIYRYFAVTGKEGIGGVLLMLADYLARHLPAPDPQQWGHILEGTTAPLLEAYFKRYDAVVAPSLLLSGTDLIQDFGVSPSPMVGSILGALREEQAAGTITTLRAAKRFVRRMIRSGH